MTLSNSNATISYDLNNLSNIESSVYNSNIFTPESTTSIQTWVTDGTGDNNYSYTDYKRYTDGISTIQNDPTLLDHVNAQNGFAKKCVPDNGEIYPSHDIGGTLAEMMNEL